MTRLLQVHLDSVKSAAFIGIIHELAEVMERSTVVLIDYLYPIKYNSKAVISS